MEVVMEEKERYEVISPGLIGYVYIHDFKTDNVLNIYYSCDLLNQQDKRIKELEEENKNLVKALNGDIFINYKLHMENAQLKQQLHDLPKKIVEYIKFFKGFYFDWKIGQKIFPAFKITEEDLDTILKKYGGEDE